MSAPERPPFTARSAGVLVAVLLLCWLAALILGEYEFDGLLPWIGGPLYGTVIGEIIVEGGHHRSWPITGLGAVIAGGSFWRAAELSTADGLREFPAAAWAGVALAVVAVVVRTAPSRRRPPPEQTLPDHAA